MEQCKPVQKLYESSDSLEKGNHFHVVSVIIITIITKVVVYRKKRQLAIITSRPYIRARVCLDATIYADNTSVYIVFYTTCIYLYSAPAMIILLFICMYIHCYLSA